MTQYLISALAKKLQISADTIRFYEKKGLIQPIFRANNQYRYYDHSALKRLSFIKHCRALDLSLKEIESLIQLEQKPDADCALVNEMIDQHLESISKKISDLKKLKQQLTELRSHCHQATSIDHCQILKTLEQPDG